MQKILRVGSLNCAQSAKFNNTKKKKPESNDSYRHEESRLLTQL